MKKNTMISFKATKSSWEKRRESENCKIKEAITIVPRMSSLILKNNKMIRNITNEHSTGNHTK